jgi:leucyl/phenylalanyl-tRNA--protein transferase
MVYLVTDDQPNWFPHPAFAPANGLLAVSHTLNPDRVALAYHSGIFPWETYGDPPLWHWFSPDPRCVLLPEDFKPGRYLKAALHKGTYQVRVDTVYEQVMRACATVPRPRSSGESWIEEDMIEVYTLLHRRGYAHSFEAWLDGELVGGLYGLSYGRAFFGESMFHHAPEASRVAFAALVDFCLRNQFHFIDCQVETPHILKFGAHNISRKVYLEKLREALRFPTIHKRWTDFQPGFQTSQP